MEQIQFYRKLDLIWITKDRLPVQAGHLFITVAVKLDSDSVKSIKMFSIIFRLQFLQKLFVYNLRKMIKI